MLLFSVKKKWLELQVAFWKKIAISSQSKKDTLSTKAKEFETRRQVEVNKRVSLMRADLHRMPDLKARIMREYALWKKAVYKDLMQSIGVCEKCGRHETVMTIDHIIPQEILRQMGIDPETDRHAENLQLLCKICNTQKANKLDFTNQRTKPLLLMYLRLVEGPETLAEKPKQKKESMLDKWKSKEARKAEIIERWGPKLGEMVIKAEAGNDTP